VTECPENIFTKIQLKPKSANGRKPECVLLPACFTENIKLLEYL